MFDFRARPDADPAAAWEDAIAAASAIVAGEDDAIANMANVAALLWELVPGLNWAGFYRVIGDELVLGPFHGRPACIRIAIGKGVCGTAAAEARSVRVADVHAFPGHIACDAASAAELVVPVLAGGRVVAVLDLDSPTAGRFTAADQVAAERLCALLVPSFAA